MRAVSVAQSRERWLREPANRRCPAAHWGNLLPSEASINKLQNCDLLVEMSDLALELQGNSASYYAKDENSIDAGRWQQMAIAWPATVVVGGTPNVQKNIIAEQMLGLGSDSPRSTGASRRRPSLW